MCPLGDKFVVDGPEPGHRDGDAFAIHADLGILAETAAQVAAGKKDRARSAVAADARLFPKMQGRPCQHRLEWTVAVAGKVRADAVTGKGPDDMALTGTVRAGLCCIHENHLDPTIYQKKDDRKCDRPFLLPD